MDYLPGSVMFDPIVDAPDARLASRIVWFDALMTNVDRTVRNPNILMWHRRLWLIDHGASLYFHHASHWEEDRAREAAVRHVERPPAGETRHDAVDEEMAAALTPEVTDAAVGLVPESWLQGHGATAAPGVYREAYRRYLRDRVAPPRPFIAESARAR